MGDESFRIKFASSNTDTFPDTLEKDAILYTNSNISLHIGVKNSPNYISITSNITKIQGDVQIMGFIFDSQSNIYSIGGGGGGEGGGTFTLPANAISTTMLQNKSVTVDKLVSTSGIGSNVVLSIQPEIVAPRISGGITLIPGNQQGAYIQINNVNIADNAVSTSKLQDESVTTDKIATSNVTNSKMALDSINTVNIINKAVTSSKLADNAVTTSTMATNAVTTSKIADLAVTTNKIDIDAVTTSRILDLNVTNNKIGSNAITWDKIANQQITSNKIRDHNVTYSKLDPELYKAVYVIPGEFSNNVYHFPDKLTIGTTEQPKETLDVKGTIRMIQPGPLIETRQGELSNNRYGISHHDDELYIHAGDYASQSRVNIGFATSTNTYDNMIQVEKNGTFINGNQNNSNNSFALQINDGGIYIETNNSNSGLDYLNREEYNVYNTSFLLANKYLKENPLEYDPTDSHSYNIRKTIGRDIYRNMNIKFCLGSNYNDYAVMTLVTGFGYEYSKLVLGKSNVSMMDTNVGIGTLTPVEKLDVYGNIISDHYTFHRATRSDKNGTFFSGMVERIYQYSDRFELTITKTKGFVIYKDALTSKQLIIYKTNNDANVEELLFYKANYTSNNIPDRISHIAGQHVFNTYLDYNTVWRYNDENPYLNTKEVMRITLDGKVGIGITNPEGKLEVAGNIVSDHYTFYKADIDNPKSDRFYSGMVERIYKLSDRIEFALYGDNDFIIYDDDVTSNELFIFQNDTITNSAELLFYKANALANGDHPDRISHIAGQHVFHTYLDSNTIWNYNYDNPYVNTKEAMRITLDGKVGIGTISPDVMLHITDDLGSNATIKVGTSSGTDGQIQFGNSNHGIGRGNNLPGATNENDLIIHTTGGIGFVTNYSDLRMYVAPNGNLTVPGIIDMGSSLGTRKLVLWQSDNNDNSHMYYGMGISAATLRYHTTGSHVFYTASNSNASKEIMYIDTNGVYPSATDTAGTLGNTTRRWSTIYGDDGNFTGDIVTPSFNTIQSKVWNTQRLFQTADAWGWHKIATLPQINNAGNGNKITVEGVVGLWNTAAMRFYMTVTTRSGVSMYGEVSGDIVHDFELYQESDGTYSLYYRSTDGLTSFNFMVTCTQNSSLIEPNTNKLITTPPGTLVKSFSESINVRRAANGDVGIGTSNPVYKLDVADSSTSGAVVGNFMCPNLSSVNGLIVNISVGQTNAINKCANFRYSSSNNTAKHLGLGFWGNDDIITITPNGNVGIETIAPSYKLDVVGSTSNDAIIKVGTPTNGDGKIYFGNLNHGIGRGSSIPGATTGNDVTVYTTAAGVGITTNSALRMYVTAGGNVGIGTSNPTEKLYVSGNISATGNVNITSGVINMGETTEPKKLMLYGDNTDKNRHDYYGFGIAGSILRYQVPTSASHVFYVATSTNVSREAMRINQNGRLGIGVNNDNFTLQLFGNVNSNNTSHVIEVQSNPNSYSGMIINNGDFGAQSLLLYGGGSYQRRRGIIQAKDTFRNENIPLLLNPDGSLVGIGTSNPSYTLDVVGDINASGEVRNSGIILTSDDRVKSDECFIENATHTLNKLRPQIYNKWNVMDYVNNSNAVSKMESGLIAQEVFYDAPELRYLVNVPADADSNIIYNSNITSSGDPSIDPDYTSWGSNIAALNYIGLIPYTIKAIQELDKENKSFKTRISVLETENEMLKVTLSNILMRLDNANIR